MIRRAVVAAAAGVTLLSSCALAQRATAAAAQKVEFRPFALVSGEYFAASTTFDATLGSAIQPMWGAGVEINTRRNLFLDITVSRLSRSGQFAFDDNGQVFRLATPLHATLTPFELTVGRRFPPKTRPGRRRRITVIPYVGLGAGIYWYQETSDFSTAGEIVDAAHAGFVAVGGAEFRVSKWVGVTGDAQYTRVPGILGKGGVSQQANENDLGGVAGRVRVILGR